MNIESLLDRIDLFKKVVIDSGFKRDVEQYLSALSNPETQSNLSSLKDIAVKVHAALQLINESGLEDALDVVRPTVKSFTDFDYLEQLDNLLTDPDIQTPAFANSLRDVLNSLVKQIKLDKTDLDNREIIFQDYTSQSNESSSDAVLAVILKDTDTITGLKKFSRTLDRWNQALLLFHDLVKSDSPKEIALVEVQNGSIDVIINVDISVAVDLVVVLTAGYKAFKAFLEYKIKKEEILSAFQGNKELQKLEEKAETLLLDGIGKQVEAKIREIHRDRKKQDSKIRGEGINASIPRISNLLTDQIVKGNEVKLLSSAENHEEDTESEDLANELSENARVVRKLRNSLSVDERRLLTTKYELSDEEK